MCIRDRPMAHGSRLKAHGSCLKARGSRLMAKKNLALGPGPGGPRAKSFLAMSHEPWATSLEAWAMSLEPWTMPLTVSNRLLNELLDSKVPRSQKSQSFKVPELQSSKVQKFQSFKGSNLFGGRCWSHITELPLHVVWKISIPYSRVSKNDAGHHDFVGVHAF